MKKIITCFLIFTSFSYAMGEYFIDEFIDNKNKWYTNSTKTEEVLVRNGNYIIKNLDENTDLSLATSKPVDGFYALEYSIKNEGNEGSMYGVFIELESMDRFYLLLNKDSIGYFYEKDKKMGILENFEQFPFLYKEDYNSIVLIKEEENFTFLINQIPTEKTWALRGSKIKRIGLYLNNSTNVYLNRYTEFTL